MWNEGIQQHHLGFSIYIGAGNEVDISFGEYLEFLCDDRDTSAIAMYVEGFRDGRGFLETARRVCQTKPVVLYKGGRSRQGAESALSHTGAMAGSSRVADDVLRQAGVTVVDRLDELFSVSEALSTQPATKGSRIAVLADGGGHATAAADALADAGIALRYLGLDTQAALRRLLPEAANVSNPVDVAGGTDRDPGVLRSCFEVLLRDSDIDGILYVGVLGGYGIRFQNRVLTQIELEVADYVVDAVRHFDKPIVMASAYSLAHPEIHERLRSGGVPVFQSIEIATSSIVALAKRGEFARRVSNQSWGHLGTHRIESERSNLSEPDARRLLARYGVDFGVWEIAGSEGEAAELAKRIGSPVAMKVISKSVVHKSDLGGVILNVAGPDAARAAYRDIVEAVSSRSAFGFIEGVLMAPMAPRGVELIVGAIRDSTFGPLIMLGLGGIWTEAVDRVVFRAPPIDAVDVGAMFDELGSDWLLQGARGYPPVHIPAVAELVTRFAKLIEREPTVVEADLNPVIVVGGTVVPVDARIVVAS
jgi:acetyltransferase